MRAALYVRVSTEDQAREGFSMDAQKRKLESYCFSRGWKIADIYEDDGYSGRDIRRKAYTRMMNDDIGEWDVILVLKMDRIHRNSVNFTGMMNILKEKGKEFNSVQEKFDTTTAMGRFVMDIMQRIAQLESEQIGERVKMGMERKARCSTGTLGSGHPYGYSYSNGALIVQEEEASVVRMIYDMAVDGLGPAKIACSLNDDNIPAKKGGTWNRQSVHRILRNPLYTGKRVWDGITGEGEHDSIISETVFEAVNGGT